MCLGRFGNFVGGCVFNSHIRSKKKTPQKGQTEERTVDGEEEGGTVDGEEEEAINS